MTVARRFLDAGNMGFQSEFVNGIIPIYFVAFGEPETFECLRAGLESLSEFARYDGEVLIVTDKDWSHVKWVVPDVLRDRTYMWKTPASNFVEYCMLRWRACEWSQFHQFQPALYVDTDVVFDSDLTPFLASLAMSRTITAAREDYSPLSTAESVGARLFEDEGLSLTGECGFNSGAIGIPNLARSGRDCRLVLDTMQRFLAARPDGKSIGWFDQSLANYASRKVARFDLDLLSRYHQFDWTGNRADPNKPLGMVHFWGGGADHKLRRMTDYMRALRSGQFGAHVP
jgi:hypothetical protein